MERKTEPEAGREFEYRNEHGVRLRGELRVPAHAKALVVFAHGSGSNRNSPRNRFVARRLEAAGYGSLLLDLAEPDEEPLLATLAARLLEATRELAQDPELGPLPQVYFGASTGAAVALLAAAQRPSQLRAVIARGGRPDLVASAVLARLDLPLLFLVGSLDEDVLALNRRACRALRCDHELDVVAGASHLFEEPGTLERVADRVVDFLRRKLSEREPEVADEPDRALAPREDGLGVFDDAQEFRRFADRKDAGAQLAAALATHRDSGELVLGVPRGGVPVAHEVARRLHLPLDVAVARKLGAPGREELAIGAVTPDGTVFLNEGLIDVLRVSDSYLEQVTSEQCAEARRRERRFRAGRAPLQLQGRSVILVDDGLATGATLRAVVRALRAAKVGHLTLAVPVGAPQTCAELSREVDELVCPYRPANFYAVGVHYAHFGQTSDSEVEQLLRDATETEPADQALRRAPSRA